MREEIKREGDKENREEDKQNVGTYIGCTYMLLATEQ